jgi:hypothetical protein
MGSQMSSSLQKFNAETAPKLETRDHRIDEAVLVQLNSLFRRCNGRQDDPRSATLSTQCVTMSVVKLLTRIVAPSDSNVTCLGTP